MARIREFRMSPAPKEGTQNMGARVFHDQVVLPSVADLNADYGDLRHAMGEPTAPPLKPR